MKINPPGGPSPNDAYLNTPERVNAGKPSAARPVEPGNVAEALPGTETSGVAARFTRADLNNPQAVDTMVRETVGELVQTQWAGKANLSPADEQNLVNFMSADPTVRKQVERWLDKVLK
jgi:hypothetical protein